MLNFIWFFKLTFLKFFISTDQINPHSNDHFIWKRKFKLLSHMFTPVRQLLDVSGFISFHQMCAYTTICSSHKIMISREPKPLYNIMLATRQELDRTRRGAGGSFLPYKLSISRDSYLYQASRLYSRIPDNLSAESIPEFKKKIRVWVKQNISLYM